MSDNSIHIVPASDGLQPLSNREKFEERFPHVAAILRDEETLRREENSTYNAHQAALASNAVKRAEAEHVLMVEERSPKRSKVREERALKEIERVKAERAEIDRRHNEFEKNRSGSLINVINEFFASQAAHRRYRAAETADTLLPGKTAPEMAAFYREQIPLKLAEEKAIVAAPQSRAEIESDIAKGVAKHAARLQMAVNGVRKVTYDSKYRRFTPRGLTLPRLAIADGLGLVTHVPDGLGVLCALFGEEMTDRLTAMALQGLEDAKTLDAATRTQRLAEVYAEIRDIEYKAELWHRRARAIGANPGPRASTNVLAILDLVPA